MPDFERAFDGMRIDLATNPEDKAKAIGFAEGKTFARKEVLIIIVIILSIAALIFINSK